MSGPLVALVLGLAYLGGFLFVVRTIVGRVAGNTSADMEFELFKFFKFRSNVTQSEIQREIERDPDLSKLGGDSSHASESGSARPQPTPSLPKDGSASSPGQTSDMSSLMEEWLKRLAATELAHRLSSQRGNRQSSALSIAVATTALGAGGIFFVVLAYLYRAFEDFSPGAFWLEYEGWWLALLGGILCILAAAGALSQMFLHLTSRAERHRLAADRYAAIRRRISVQLANSAQTDEQLRRLLDVSRRTMDVLAEESPEIGERVWIPVARQFGVMDSSPLTTAGLASGS